MTHNDLHYTLIPPGSYIGKRRNNYGDALVKVKDSTSKSCAVFFARGLKNLKYPVTVGNQKITPEDITELKEFLTWHK